MEAASTEDEKHTETGVIRQCLLADRAARKARSWTAASVISISMYVCI